MRCVYRSLSTLSWFWTVWMIAFTISELSLLTSGSGADRLTNHLCFKIRCRDTFIDDKSDSNVSYFCISSSAACRARWPFPLCNTKKHLQHADGGSDNMSGTSVYFVLWFVPLTRRAQRTVCLFLCFKADLTHMKTLQSRGRSDKNIPGCTE